MQTQKQRSIQTSKTEEFRLKVVLVRKKMSSHFNSHFYLNSMPVYVKLCLQIQIVDYMNCILKDNFIADWMSTGFGIKNRLRPESASLCIKLDSSPFFLPFSGTFHRSWTADPMSAGCHHFTVQRTLSALGWVSLDINGVCVIRLCFFTWVYALELNMLRRLQTT